MKYRNFNLLPLLLYLPLILIALVAAIVFYWNVQPTDVLDIKNTPYPVRPDTVDPGSAVVVSANYCKLQAINGSLVVRFVGKKSIIRSPDTSERGPKGCQKLEFPILLPPQLAHDTYYIEFQSTYRINPITTVDEVSRSQEFTVR